MIEPSHPAGNGLRQISELAEAAGSRWTGDTLPLPASVGHGYIRSLSPEPGVRLGIHHYTLAQEVVVHRYPDATAPEALLLSCQAFDTTVTRGRLSTAQLASTTLGFTTTLPAHTEMLLVTLLIERARLTDWLAGAEHLPPIFPLGSAPLVLDALLTPELQTVLREISSPRPAQALTQFFYRIKAQELVYWLLQELAQRTGPTRPVHTADVARIYQFRDRLLAQLSAAPSLPDLAQAVGLSQTKLNLLFRQIFGSSPYEYFQQARLAQAKHQLQFLSVSEVGYHLGFTNLSHFARLFQRHYGLTPKKYQAALPRGVTDKSGGLD